MKLQHWLISSSASKYFNALFVTRGNDDFVVNRQIRKTLRAFRLQRAVQPWLALPSFLFQLLKEVTHGQYRKPSASVRGGATQSTGASAGTFSASSAPASASASYSISAAGQTFEDAGIRAGEVVAYRCWQLKDGLLWSMYRDKFLWPPGKIVEGDPSQHGEGVHGFKDRLSACQYIGVTGGFLGIVSGTVELWGNVYEHQLGYRASKARIASIDDSPNYDAAALRKTYKLHRKTKR